MQIRRIQFTPQRIQPQTQFKGSKCDEVDDIASTSFRDDELFDERRDSVNNGYRIYDYNELPLTVSNRDLSVPVPPLYKEVYELRDARVPRIDTDLYVPVSQLGILNNIETYNSQNDQLSISDEFIVRELAFLNTKEGKVYNKRLHRDLKEFAIHYPSGNQKLTRMVANACKIQDSNGDECFSRSIFNTIYEICKSCPKSLMASTIADVQDLASVARFRKSDGSVYWNNEVLSVIEMLNYFNSDFSPKEQKKLIKACIVKDQLNNDRLVLSAVDYCLEKAKSCKNEHSDILLSALRTGVQYNKNIQDYKFDKEAARKHYVAARNAYYGNDKSFEWNLPTENNI